MAPADAADPGVTQDAIVFGQAAAFTGPAATLGLEVRTGILAAFEEANRQGGVGERQLKLISYDDGYEPERSVEATRKLIEDDKVFALIGAVGTPTSTATEPMAIKAGVPFIGAFSGAEFLREPFNADVVNVRASYFQETETLVAYLTEQRGLKRVAVLYQDDAFGRAGLVGVSDALARRGMTIAAQASFERNTTAVKMAALAIRQGSPQAVVMIGPYKPCAEFVRLARLIGVDAQFAGISFLGSDAFARELGHEAAGTIVTQVMPSADAPLPVVAAYRAALAKLDPSATPNAVSLEGYVAARLTIAALEKIEGEPTREGFLSAIRGASFDLDGFALAYGRADNRGSNRVYLTVIGPDGSSRPVAEGEKHNG
ncbi:MAG TPA: ABC transporter substrate-binding protein [Roseiarcus sp.]|nr:ABC transporter substrate-binding protein [Roseiarcus sp.]